MPKSARQSWKSLDGMQVVEVVFVEDGEGRHVHLDLGLILLPGIHQQHILVPDIGVVAPPPPWQLPQRACC